MSEVIQGEKNQRNANTALEAAVNLPNSKSIYDDLFRHMNDGVICCRVIYDEQGKPVDYQVEEVNPAFRHILQIHKPLLGMKATEVLSDPQKPGGWMEKCGQVAQMQRSCTAEEYLPLLDRWISFYSYSPKQGYVAIIAKDVTARKKAELALRQSEKQYKQLANSIADPFFALDSSLKITYWNRASEEYTGIIAGKVLNKPFLDFFEKSKVTLSAVKAYLNVMKTGKPRSFIGELPNCEDKIFEIHIYPTGNGVSVFAKDATERKKIQTSLEAYTQQLEQLVKERTEKLKEIERLATIGETAGMVGHDIRNPLQSIVGELYLARDEVAELPQDDHKSSLQTSITMIEDQILYINKIVTDLQDYAKTLIPTLEEVDLQQIIEAVLPTIQLDSNIAVSYYIHQPFAPFRCDPSFLKRILTNLLRNGAQAMQENGGSLLVNAFQHDKSVIISVTDTGSGIPDEVRDRIFKPLFTTKSKGQGFGLAVVKKLVEALGGTVSFESKVGRGTTFVLELPTSPCYSAA